MATRRIIEGRRSGLYSTPMMRGRAAAGTNFFIGSLLFSTTAQGGFLIEAGADPRGILGIAKERGGNTTDSSNFVQFVPALPHVMFEATVLGAAAAQVALSDTMLWRDYGITKDGTSSWYVDVSKGSSGSGVGDGLARVRVVELIDDTNTVDGRVQFIFLPEHTAFHHDDV